MKAASPFALSLWTVAADSKALAWGRQADTRLSSLIDLLGAEVTSVTYDLFNSGVILSPVQDPWSCCVLSAMPKSQLYLARLSCQETSSFMALCGHFDEALCHG